MANDIFNQLFIEGENNQLYIYIHLKLFDEKKAAKILDKYVDSFKRHDFEKIYVLFWNVSFPGEHLSSFRRTSNVAIGKLLKGFKYINSFYDFKNQSRLISEPQLIN
jgi:hypothetical protein